MAETSFVLSSDGSSDRALIPILKWLLQEQFSATHAFIGNWGDLRNQRQPPKTFPERIERCLKLYPSDLLFIHRDAEGQSTRIRLDEIQNALTQVRQRAHVEIPQYVCVVPVRMQEAWLLFDEQAIRNAAENPNGKVELNLPRLSTVEHIPDPKETLDAALESASELTGRRLKKFQTRISASRVHVSELIADFSPLRILPAFQRLEADIQNLQIAE